GRWGLDEAGPRRAGARKNRAILGRNPNHTTGAALNHKEKDAGSSTARRVGAWSVAVAISRGAELEGTPLTPSFWGRYERTVVTGGLSKAFGLPGLRIGWGLAPPSPVKKIRVRPRLTT